MITGLPRTSPGTVSDSILLARSSEKLQVITHTSPNTYFVSHKVLSSRRMLHYSKNSVLASISFKSTKQTWQLHLKTIP